MEIVSIVNRKGGCGKTTTAHTLGAGLLQEGYRVLYIDLDSQANLSLILNASDEYISSFDILQGESIKHAVQRTKNGDIVRGDYLLSTIRQLQPDTLQKQLAKIKNRYDYCIIDTGPSFDACTVNALTASDRIVITSQADLLGYQGIATLLETVNAVKAEYNQGLIIDGILLTRYNKRAILQQQYRDAIRKLAEENGTRLYDAYIRECNALKETQAMQQSIFTYARNSNAAKDYRQFIDELLGK